MELEQSAKDFSKSASLDALMSYLTQSVPCAMQAPLSGDAQVALSRNAAVLAEAGMDSPYAVQSWLSACWRNDAEKAARALGFLNRYRPATAHAPIRDESRSACRAFAVGIGIGTLDVAVAAMQADGDRSDVTALADVVDKADLPDGVAHRTALALMDSEWSASALFLLDEGLRRVARRAPRLPYEVRMLLRGDLAEVLDRRPAAPQADDASLRWSQLLEDVGHRALESLPSLAD